MYEVWGERDDGSKVCCWRYWELEDAQREYDYQRRTGFYRRVWIISK